MIAEHTIRRFAGGECHLLALRLHLLTGWPLVALVNESDPDEVCHVATVAPNGNLLDIEGEHDPDLACEVWASCFEPPEVNLRQFPFEGWSTGFNLPAGGLSAVATVVRRGRDAELVEAALDVLATYHASRP